MTCYLPDQQNTKIKTNKQTKYQLKFQIQASQLLVYREFHRGLQDCDVLDVQDDKSAGTLGSCASSKLPDGADVWTTFRSAWCCRIFCYCDSKDLETVRLVSQSQWTYSTHSLHQHPFSNISTPICTFLPWIPCLMIATQYFHLNPGNMLILESSHTYCRTQLLFLSPLSFMLHTHWLASTS